MWVLIVFLEEDVLSHPIRLEEIQDLSGWNGVEADLQEGDQCIWPDITLEASGVKQF